MEPPCDLFRLSAEQNADPVLCLDDLTLQISQLSSGSSPFRLESIEIELRDSPLFVAKLGQANRFIPGLEGALGDIHLVIQSTEIEIRLGHRTDQAEDDRTLIFFFRQ